ncbi:hypothetical protein V492_00915 [Pseudogymnoascus sp. VKM F-4246]|nr:hypothetical protein V492_00915 [Pseudogymnoascus sp. VKM F-4246]
MLLPSLFRRLLCLISTLSLLPMAIAGGIAGVYERVGPVYQTYRIAIATWGVGQPKMLQGLTGGTHPDGGANFVEVVNYLDTSKKRVDIDTAEFLDEVGSVNDPDPHRAADYMIVTASDAKLGNLPLARIFEGIPDDFSTVLGQVRTVLQEAHERMKTDGRLDEIKPFRDRLNVCHKAIIRLRQSDMVAGTDGTGSMIKDIKKKWPKALFQLDTARFGNIQSQWVRIFTVNMDETIKKSPKDLFTRAEVWKWITEYGRDINKDTDTAMDHYKVISQHKATQTIALGVPSIAPSIIPSMSAFNWKTFKGNGVNLGGWLIQEAVIDPIWWSQYSGGALDEWDLCAHLGTQCGPVLEQRCCWCQHSLIPTTYAAWVKVPGSQLYSGNQKQFLKNIATYAINKYKMHIIVDVHSLPGGVNGMGFGEAEGHFGWFNNHTALASSYEAIDAVVEFVQSSGFPQYFTIEPINEPVDNLDMTYFGTPEALSEAGAAWTLQYVTGVIQRITATNPDIPLMFQGSFRGESYWLPQFSESTNLVFDVHNYYFAGRPTDSDTVSVDICSDVKASAGDGKFPVWIGKWSIQTASDNKFANRRKNLNTGLYAFNKYTQGSAYWTAKFYGDVPVEGEGVQGDYWNYESFINLGPLKVLVAGGGIGGLSAAIFLRHAGHHIFESSKFASETGAAIHIPSNANGLLRRMGMIPEDHGANLTEWVSEYRPDGEMVFRKDVRPLSSVFPYPWQLIHRVDLHNALKDIAMSREGKGLPVVLNLRSKVVHINIDTPSLTLEDGSTYTGDLIIGADGVHSKLRSFIAKDCPLPTPSGSSAFRFLIPADVIRADAKTAHFLERKGEMRLLYGTNRRIVIYPCRNNTLINFAAMHPDEETEAEGDDWDLAASKDSMLSCFSSYPEDVQILLAKASVETIKLWKLLDHEELGKDNWVRGKACLLGDAAHAFLPHQGQGGAQAIEDGAALGALFPLGTQASDVPRRLQLYVQARYDRATLVQDFTRQAAFKTSRGKHGGKVIDPMQFMGVNFRHDAYDHAHGILIRELARSATYQRAPFSFGPCPGPRQDHIGRVRNLGEHSYKTSYLTFKTHKSYISTLLPGEELSIDTDGSWATATFAVTRLANLTWLGGRGYSFFALYIHDVTSDDKGDSNASTVNKVTTGSGRKGDFVPVMFENKADPIITGREELGFSKVFATLEDTSTSSSYTLSAGWESTEFCNLALEGLVEVPVAEPTTHAPTLHWNVVKSNEECAHNYRGTVTVHPPFPTSEGQRKWKAGSAKVNFTDLEGQQLVQAFPTLSHVIDGLRSIKIVEVLKSGVLASGDM